MPVNATWKHCKHESKIIKLTFETTNGLMSEQIKRYEKNMKDVFVFITHNTRILFHKAHLYKSIRCIFTCEKSLYSQSELRTAISHVKV